MAYLIPKQGKAFFVFDTPPTIPGLSRTCMSLALRLAGPEKKPLAKGGGFPSGLEETPINWKSFLVTTPDLQDLRSVTRWLSLIPPEKENLFRILVNRIGNTDPNELQNFWEQRLPEEIGSPLLEEASFIPDHADAHFFHSEQFPAESEWIAQKFLEDLI